MYDMTSKYLSIVKNALRAILVAHVTRDFHACYSCWYYSFVDKSKTFTKFWIITFFKCKSLTVPETVFLWLILNRTKKVITDLFASFFVSHEGVLLVE